VSLDLVTYDFKYAKFIEKLSGEKLQIDKKFYHFTSPYMDSQSFPFIYCLTSKGFELPIRVYEESSPIFQYSISSQRLPDLTLGSTILYKLINDEHYSNYEGASHFIGCMAYRLRVLGTFTCREIGRFVSDSIALFYRDIDQVINGKPYSILDAATGKLSRKFQLDKGDVHYELSLVALPTLDSTVDFKVKLLQQEDDEPDKVISYSLELSPQMMSMVNINSYKLLTYLATIRYLYRALLAIYQELQKIGCGMINDNFEDMIKTYIPSINKEKFILNMSFILDSNSVVLRFDPHTRRFSSDIPDLQYICDDITDLELTGSDWEPDEYYFDTCLSQSNALLDESDED
jgi:hypothetical protein